MVKCLSRWPLRWPFESQPSTGHSLSSSSTRLLCELSGSTILFLDFFWELLVRTFLLEDLLELLDDNLSPRR